MQQSFRFELDPTNKQRTLLAQHAGLSRFVWNWALAQVLDALDARTAGHDVKVPRWIDLDRRWRATRDEDAPFAVGLASDVPTQTLRDLERARQALFAGRSRFPRFKKKGRCTDSFRVKARVHAQGKSVRLALLGWIRTKESTEKMDGRIVSATVMRVADRWFVTFSVERDRPMPPPRTGKPVGVDLGLKAFATTSDGEVLPHPKPYVAALRKQRRLNKAVSRKQKGSANRRKAAMKLARHHARVANIRRDAIHKATTHLAKTKPVIVLEDLNVKGMVRNRHLARSISDAGWGEFRRQLAYKCEWYGSTLIVADRFFPSSKTCSECGWVDVDQTLKDREFRCQECGLILDRDLNAAINLSHVAARETETLNACREDVRPASAGADLDEAGTRQLVRA